MFRPLIGKVNGYGMSLEGFNIIKSRFRKSLGSSKKITVALF